MQSLSIDIPVIQQPSKALKLTSQFGLQEIINEPTHIQETSVSCIDLIFASQPKLVMVWVSTHPFTKIAIIR